MHAWLERAAERIDPSTPLRLTLVVLLLRPPEGASIRSLTWALAGAGLVWPALMARAGFWGAVTAAVGVRLVVDWPLADNHIYLFAYWCLAVTLASMTSDRDATVRRSARWLVGLTFLCAVVWKAALSPEFLDGRFFRVTLMTDDRFEWVVRTAGGVDLSTLASNRAALAPLPPGVELLSGPTLEMPLRVSWLAGGLTWAGIALEAALAIAFLAPLRTRLSAARHALLLAFCASTYVVAPVAGFGWLLVILGLAHAPEDRALTRLAYMVTFGAIGLFGEAQAADWLAALG